MIRFIFALIAIAQGSFVMGFTFFIFLYYLPRKKTDMKDPMRLHVISISASYILLTFATIYTSINGNYTWKTVWYWIVFGSYILGDISLLCLFKDLSLRQERKKNVKEVV